MLTAEDKKEIRKIVKEEVRIEVRSEVEKCTDPIRESIVNIEATLGGILDLHQILVEHSEKLTDHEDRISVLESA